MSMNVGNKGVKSDINITPYIDILLVLLIIFMTTAPIKPKDHTIRLPKPVVNQMQKPDPNVIVVDMDINHAIKLKEKSIPLEKLEAALKYELSLRPAKSMFVRGDSDLPYGDIFILLDIARNSGATDIALIEKKIY
jgi:biopolymer transport protein TolR